MKPSIFCIAILFVLAPSIVPSKALADSKQYSLTTLSDIAHEHGATFTRHDDGHIELGLSQSDAKSLTENANALINEVVLMLKATEHLNVAIAIYANKAPRKKLGDQATVDPRRVSNANQYYTDSKARDVHALFTQLRAPEQRYSINSLGDSAKTQGIYFYFYKEGSELVSLAPSS